MMTNEVLAFCDESFALKCPDILCSLKWAWNSSSSRCIFCHDCTVCCIILIIPAPRLLQWQHCNIPLLLLSSGHYKVIIRCVNKPNGLQIQKKVTEKQIDINIYDLRLAAVRWWPGPGVVSCSWQPIPARPWSSPHCSQQIFSASSQIFLQLHRRGHCWRSQKITFEIAGEGGAVDMISLDNLKFQTWVIDS